MAESDQTLLLINRTARKGDADLAAMRERLGQLGRIIEPDVSDKEGMQKVIEQQAASVRRVVVGGGDGTLHNALPSVLAAKLPLGVLPLGTANDFARSLGLTDLDTAVEAVIAGHERSVDVGVVNGHYFLNAAGVGLGPRINRELDKGSKSRLGVLSYFVNFLRSQRHSRGMRARISCDDKAVDVKSLQITIGNGIHYGGGMTVAKDARVDDGILDVLSIPPQSPFSLLLRGLAFRTGNFEGNEHVQVFRGRFVTVRTRRIMEVTADGEFVTQTPIECRVIERVLQVFAPQKPEMP
ncbi:MAG: lipid kinase [Woeseia sp.]